jgi:protein TonB
MIAGFLALKSPRLPERRWAARGTLFAITGSLHLLGVALVLFALAPARKIAAVETHESPAIMRVVLPRMVFQLSGPPGGGGGGGGNRQRGPIRHAEAIGPDATTLRTGKPPATADRLANADTALPPIVLDARPLASGDIVQIGLPIGGVSSGTSTGPGSGGGVGTGTGTGIGSGSGPGIGAGSGGGVGGGVYRSGGGVTAPRLLAQTKPKYTTEALGQKIQGSVWLEIVVTRDGLVEQVRIVRSLDPGGLDHQAVAAVRQWRFEPGRLAGTPVDVQVTVVMDFSIQ